MIFPQLASWCRCARTYHILETRKNAVIHLPPMKHITQTHCTHKTPHNNRTWNGQKSAHLTATNRWHVHTNDSQPQRRNKQTLAIAHITANNNTHTCACKCAWATNCLHNHKNERDVHTTKRCATRTRTENCSQITLLKIETCLTKNT